MDPAEAEEVAKCECCLFDRFDTPWDALRESGGREAENASCKAFFVATPPSATDPNPSRRDDDGRGQYVTIGCAKYGLAKYHRCDPVTYARSVASTDRHLSEIVGADRPARLFLCVSWQLRQYWWTARDRDCEDHRRLTRLMDSVWEFAGKRGEFARVCVLRCPTSSSEDGRGGGHGGVRRSYRLVFPDAVYDSVPSTMKNFVRDYVRWVHETYDKDDLRTWFAGNDDGASGRHVVQRRPYRPNATLLTVGQSPGDIPTAGRSFVVREFCRGYDAHRECDSFVQPRDVAGKRYDSVPFRGRGNRGVGRGPPPPSSPPPPQRGWERRRRGTERWEERDRQSQRRRWRRAYYSSSDETASPPPAPPRPRPPPHIKLYARRRRRHSSLDDRPIRIGRPHHRRRRQRQRQRRRPGEKQRQQQWQPAGRRRIDSETETGRRFAGKVETPLRFSSSSPPSHSPRSRSKSRYLPVDGRNRSVGREKEDAGKDDYYAAAATDDDGDDDGADDDADDDDEECSRYWRGR